MLLCIDQSRNLPSPFQNKGPDSPEYQKLQKIMLELKRDLCIYGSKELIENFVALYSKKDQDPAKTLDNLMNAFRKEIGEKTVENITNKLLVDQSEKK